MALRVQEAFSARNIARFCTNESDEARHSATQHRRAPRLAPHSIATGHVQISSFT